MQIHLPPLRERSEDIAPLCEFFLSAMDYANAESAIDATLERELRQRPWHGNIRELRNAIEHAAVVARGRPLAIEDFPPPKPRRVEPTTTKHLGLPEAVDAWATDAIEKAGEELSTLHSQFLAAAEPALFRVALQHTGGNRAKAAELLGIHRGTLRDRLRSYGIEDS
jgi:two-component system nitrogen regulation response regulator GlnG